MKKLFILPFFLATGCLNRVPVGEESVIVQTLPAVKQKQKIALLQRKLDAAEKEQKKAEEEVERLSSELHQAQLGLIRKQIHTIEDQIKKIQADPRRNAELLQIQASTLFLKEREMLHQMIQAGPSPSAFEAQVVLDQILQMITDLGNHHTHDRY